MKKHVDDAWINKKIDGHGGLYTFSKSNGLAVIGYIGHKNRIQVFGYNIILFFKYLRRSTKGVKRWKRS